MATSILEVNQTLRSVFTDVADRAARATEFVRRESKMSGSVFAQTLTFGWLNNPDAGLGELTQLSGALGVPITCQGLDQRFGCRAAKFLLTLLSEAIRRVVTADPVAIPILQRFVGGVWVMDSSTLTLPDALAALWPGCGGTNSEDGQAALKMQVRLNLLNGELDGPFLQAGRGQDARSDVQVRPLPVAALRLADLGYFSLEALQHLDAQEVWWLTRVKPALSYYDDEGHGKTLTELLAAQPGNTVDQIVYVGAEQRLRCRLLAVRAPAAVVEKRRRRLQSNRSRKGRRYAHADPWTLTEWTVYLSNAPVEILSLADAMVLARCRWQIELLFKLWKSEGRIDESRSAKPWHVLCEVYAKLLGMVVQHWLLLLGCWKNADRSLIRASRTVRAQALGLALILHHAHLVHKTLLLLRQCLQTGCRINKRRRYPSHFQLLLSLNQAG
jgi:hypothetical protein